MIEIGQYLVFTIIAVAAIVAWVVVELVKVIRHGPDDDADD